MGYIRNEAEQIQLGVQIWRMETGIMKKLLKIKHYKKRFSDLNFSTKKRYDFFF